MWSWFQGLPRLRYKIIIPFLVLTLLVGLTGSAISFYLVAKMLQANFDNQLIDVTRNAHDRLVEQERKNLQFLRQVAFAPPNNEGDTPAPAVADALEDGDAEGLYDAMLPYFKLGITDDNAQLDRLIAFDLEGRTLVDLEHTPALSATETYTQHIPLNFSGQWFVEDIRNHREDQLGDKFAALIVLPDSRGGQHYYFCTIAPVFSRFVEDRDAEEPPVVGGLILAMRIDDPVTAQAAAAAGLVRADEATPNAATDSQDEPGASTAANQAMDDERRNLLRILRKGSGADFVTIYDTQGRAQFTSDSPLEGVNALNLGAEALAEIMAGKTVFHTITIDNDDDENRAYQLAYSTLVIRGQQVGIISSALARDELISTWGSAQLPVLGLTLLLVIGIIVLGNHISHLITSPLEELVETATAVTTGNLARRSSVHARDEIGILSGSFNRMTEYLLGYMARLLNISSQRAAIVENLGEGVVVCDEHGTVRLINSATRRLLSLDADAPIPSNFDDLPLTPVTTPVFDGQSDDLYMLGKYILRIHESFFNVTNQPPGRVYVLQDMTSEVNIHLARTNFIATISHEMRTPLTPLRANMDMLRSGMAGPLNDQQRNMVEDITQQVVGIVSMVDNMTVVAGLDSGAMKVEPEPVDLKPVIEKGIWPLRKAAKSKGLKLAIEIPEDTPQVMADTVQLRTIVKHLVDNAVKYTDEGGVTITATCEANHVRVDIIDTGCGIEYHMIEKIFERLVRDEGDKSNERSVRGIGLGLAIVKQLVEMHNGRIWVISQPGQGSTFSFTLPYARLSGGPDDKQSTISTAA